MGGEEPRRQLHRRPVQPRRRPRVGHRRLGGPRVHRRRLGARPVEQAGPRRLPRPDHRGAARARLPAVHRRAERPHPGHHGLRGRVRGQHPRRQRLRGGLRRLLRRQEGRQPLRRRHAAVQRRHRQEGRHLHRQGPLRQRRPARGDRLLQRRQRHQPALPVHRRLEHDRDRQRLPRPEGRRQHDHLRQRRRRIRARHRPDRRTAVALTHPGGVRHRTPPRAALSGPPGSDRQGPQDRSRRSLTLECSTWTSSPAHRPPTAPAPPAAEAS
ncbi:hypothetical protein SCOCK_110006 [Actinacidiphila cocklensis]|uniref:Uncharacterized protein n=1 Tax=Actinacidiphila cocklensis TaxID=887465 RepID=A0A9W4DNI3_9ACTN|nr:hypothetical protein SCOCK_110006 [Actinacidiphila cocklensis]